MVLSIVAGPAATAATAETAATADMAGRREEGQQQQSSVDNGGGNNCQVTANDRDWSIPPGRNSRQTGDRDSAWEAKTVGYTFL